MLKKQKKEKISLKEFIDYYMEGNMRRFLRKHKNQYYFQQTYSVTLIHIKNSNKSVFKYIKQKNLHPRDLKDMLNIFITLDKHFSIGFNIKAFEDILAVEEELIDMIKTYMDAIYLKRFKTNPKRFKKYWLQPKAALIEQKARGFVHINDFDDFDINSVHLVSSVNRDYYYPLNIHTTTTQLKSNCDKIISPYIVAYLIAVEGWTRIEFPKELRG